MKAKLQALQIFSGRINNSISVKNFLINRALQIQIKPRMIANFLGQSFLSYVAYMETSKTNSVGFYEDEHLFNARKKIDLEIAILKKDIGEQVVDFPKVIYTMKGDKYIIEFLVDQRRTDIFSLQVACINDIESNQEKNKNSKNLLTEAKVQTLKNGDVMTQVYQYEQLGKNNVKSTGTINIVGEFSVERPSFKFILEKNYEVTSIDISAVISSYKEAFKFSKYSSQRANSISNITPKVNSKRASSKRNSEPDSLVNSLKESVTGSLKPADNTQLSEMTAVEAVQKIREMGVMVFLPDDKDFLTGLNWEDLAGYEKQKRSIEDTVMLSLTHSHIYDNIASKTRMRFEKNKPRAILFEGPPGTGKTTSAKIIASQVQIPQLYMPQESIMSKYYGEAEKNLSQLFELARGLKEGCIIFIDEVDTLGGSRDTLEMHEVSRRLLSSLLRKLDSFESNDNTLLICATNRKHDLDQALLSRLDMSIEFALPDKTARVEIWRRYAKHLGDNIQNRLSDTSEGFSGRNIYEVCKDSERRWASKVIRGEVDEDIPTEDQYLDSIRNRKEQELA